MKRIILLILILCQMLWLSNVICSFVEKKEDFGNVSVIEFRGYSKLVKIVYNSFFDNLKKLVELSCLLPTLSYNAQQEEEKRSQKTPNGPIINFYNQFIRFNENIKQTKTLVDYLNEQFLIFVKNIVLLNYLWITLLFLYLFRLRFYYLKPRSSIDHIFYFVSV